LERLLAALDDPRTSLGVRRHLPRTISRFRTRGAAAALVARLLREPDGTTEFKILRALGRMRADQPFLQIDGEPIRAYVRRSLEDATRYAALGTRLAAVRDASPGSELLQELLGEKQRHAIERGFRALGILHPRDDMRSVHDGLTGTDEGRHAAAREILDEVVAVELRVPLLAVVEGRAEGPQFPTHEDLIRALLTDPSDSLRCIAAHHVAERNLVALRSELVRLRPITASELVIHAFDQAIESLDA
nr:hypothetical protein [Myxococcota bacterium]